MGLFGPPKIKITPHDFVKVELDRIFSPQFGDWRQMSSPATQETIQFCA